MFRLCNSSALVSTSGAMADPDVLFPVTNNFYLGNYQAAINEGSTLRVAGDSAALRDFYVYRAYLALGSLDTVLDEVSDDSGPALAGVRLLAGYLKDKSGSSAVLLQLGEWEGESAFVASAEFCVAGASVHMHEGDYAAALKLLHQHRSMECLALQVQCLLGMDRADLAATQVASMGKLDDDHTLTKLASAWVAVAQGGDKYERALEVYEELVDSYGTSLVLLNGLGVCNLHLRRFDVAEKHLIDAIGMSSGDPDTLVNLITCARHMGKPSEFVDRYVKQLKRSSPDHPYVKSLETVSAAFDRVAAALS